jgi:hypothetical protein
MHCCWRATKDRGNLETVSEFYGCKDIGIITEGGTDYRKVARCIFFKHSIAQIDRFHQ